MTGDDVRSVYEAILPDEMLDQWIEKTGFQQRERKLQARLFARSAFISASTGYGGRQADVMRVYYEHGAPKVVRGASYSWFNSAFEQLTVQARDRALAHARSLPLDLPGMLGAHVRDWHIVDSSTVKLDNRLKAEYPGTGNYAALKIHKRFSVGLGAVWDYHISPAREHDAPHLVVDESWRGLGLLADLGYASHALLRDCERHGVKFVIRLKEGWKPKVEEIHRGELTRTLLKGADFDALIEEGILKLAGRSIDLDVVLGRGKQAVRCRLVGLKAPKGWCWYLTNLPRTATPAQILDLYRVRWEIESDNKLDKSCLRLDEIKARTGPAVRALVHASMVGSMMVSLVAHHHRMKERPPPRKGAERTKPPLHVQMMARMVGSSSMTIAGAFDLRGKEADDRWEFIAGLLVHQGQDPNWRTRPSVLDQLRGWRITPGKTRRERAASVRARRAN